MQGLARSAWIENETAIACSQPEPGSGRTVTGNGEEGRASSRRGCPCPGSAPSQPNAQGSCAALLCGLRAPAAPPAPPVRARRFQPRHQAPGLSLGMRWRSETWFSGNSALQRCSAPRSWLSSGRRGAAQPSGTAR